MTQNETKLTLAFLEGELKWLIDGVPKPFDAPLMSETYPQILQALIASQTALRRAQRFMQHHPSCQVLERPTRPRGQVVYPCTCGSDDAIMEIGAALLEQGETDE